MCALACGTSLSAPLFSVGAQSRAAFSGYEVVHESWSVVDGLPVNSINQLVQSRDGYIWAATFDGLVRFDGVKFTVFNSANSPGLPSDRIVWMQEGVNGTLWLVTEQRHLVRWRRGQFTVVGAAGRLPADFLPLLTEGDGATWVGTTIGLARVVGDSLVPVLHDEIRGAVNALLRTRDGVLVVGMAQGGIVRFHTPSVGQIERRYEPMDSTVSRLTLQSLFEESSGTLWIGAAEGIYSNRDGWKVIPSTLNTSFGWIGRIVANPAGRGAIFYGRRRYGPGLSVAEANNPRSVVISDGTHLEPLAKGKAVTQHPTVWSTGSTLWHGEGSTVYRNREPIYSLSSTSKANSSSFEITTGLTDREGSVWLGTFAGGLHRLKPTLVHTISEPEGLADRNVYPTYVDRAGAVWVGSWERGFARIDPVSGQIEPLSAANGLPPVARSVLETRDSTLWISVGGYPSALYRCSRAKITQCVMEAASGDTVLEVSALYEDSDSRLWVGARSGLFRRDNGRLRRLDVNGPGKLSPSVRAFAATPDGAIWMGTNGDGLLRYREGVFTSITTVNGLPSDLIRSLYVDRDGWLWVGTEGRGLARINPRGWDSRQNDPERRRIAVISTREGLFDNVIHQILEDDAGRLWMNTNRGIFWITRSEALDLANGRAARVHSTGYTERDGMRNREGNGGSQPAGAKGLDGRLWFPTQDGVVVVDPHNVAPDTVPPPLVIEQVVAGDSVLLPLAGGVRLSPIQRDIRIDFTALTFLEPRNVRFRHRLEGYDDAWVDSDTRRSAFYTKLPPGRYTFRVQTTATGTDWYEPGVVLTITVVPRIYETTWFKLIAAAALFAISAVAVQRRIRDASRKAEALERVVAERTLTLRDRERQLESQNVQLEEQAGTLRDLDRARSRFFANVSHELRTPLTLMIAPLDRLRTQLPTEDQRGVWLDLAQRNARRLLELVNQILDVAKLEAGAMRLSPRQVELSGLLRGTIESFRLSAEKKALQIHLEGPVTCNVTLDSDAFEKIVTNLLSNAVKFTPPNGHITLRLQREPDRLLLAVANTGPVVPPDKLALVFERFYQVDESNTTIQPGTGIGLSLVKELVELQRGTVHAVSTADATTFSVALPLGIADHGAPAAEALSAGATEEVADPVIRRDDPASDIPTLLIVDDSEDMRTFIRLNFESRFRVLEAGDGMEGLSMARALLPDVIVSDVMMPRLDGRGLVQQLRESEETDYLAIILLTAQAEDEQRLAGLETGADDYLVKPFEMRELDVRVRNLIAARRRLRVRYHEPSAGLTSESGTSVSDQLGVPLDLPLREPETDGEDPIGLTPEDAQYRDKVLAAIMVGLGEADFGVAELADAVFQDRSHLFRRVRQVTGVSPSELLRRLRANEGARLLRETSGSVADVAFSVGFRSVSHFYRCFQEYYKVTPAEYRSQHRA
ncbi:hybrid sensor histidine kinase/response regulator transcription factor [Gemmatimonas groenlandica]|uniref:histidine kinase n=1 Tax=Gemmatimonas groenlandica TaxID=2732249 RepID=A0A6M4IN59_9BACT|nr:hybrid sensor histidine kinase/response regulator transcription factor [Gemmatimonas groenlandica]QJR35358.1 response regulator [Gemmatimonas groenlandica]